MSECVSFSLSVYKHLFIQTAKQHKRMDRAFLNRCYKYNTVSNCPKKQQRMETNSEQSFHFSQETFRA